jgi:hypothetical protein
VEQKSRLQLTHKHFKRCKQLFEYQHLLLLTDIWRFVFLHWRLILAVLLTNLERPAKDKHSSLLREFVNYARKKFCNFGPNGLSPFLPRNHTRSPLLTGARHSRVSHSIIFFQGRGKYPLHYSSIVAHTQL